MAIITPKKARLLKDGWYPATIGTVEERDTQYGEKLFVPFEVDAKDGTLVAIDAFITISDNEKSHMVRWGEAIFGEGEFDYEDFSDQSVEVFLEESENKDGVPKNYIRKVKPAEGGSGGNSKVKGAPTKKAEVEIDESDFSDIPFAHFNTKQWIVEDIL